MPRRRKRDRRRSRNSASGTSSSASSNVLNTRNGFQGRGRSSGGGRRRFPNKIPLSEDASVEVKKVEMRKPVRKSRKPYCYVLLSWRNITIEAYSYTDYALRSFGLLQTGGRYVIRGGIFVSKKIPKFHRRSVTNTDNYWILEDITVTGEEHAGNNSWSGVGNKESYTIGHMKELADKKIPCANLGLEGVEIVKAEFCRYMGCRNRRCQKSLPTPAVNGSYYYCASCRARFPYDRYDTDTRQMYMVMKHITLKDHAGMLKNILCFNDESEKLLGKKATSFTYDEEGKALVDAFIIGSKVNLEMSIKQSNSKWPNDPMKMFITSVTVISRDASRVPPRYFVCDPVYRDRGEDDDGDDDLDEAMSCYEYMTLDSIKIKVDRAARPPPPQKASYILSSEPSGYALIINNTFSGIDDKERHGSQLDSDNLTELFEELNLRVFRDEIDSKRELETKLNLFQRRLKKNNLSCCIVVVMSHGTLNQIELTNNEYANVWTDIVDKFNDSKFPEFRGRPKIFIFNACQVSASEGSAIKCAPILKDMMLLFAAIPGHYTYRRLRKGSFFIHILVNVMMAHAASWSLNELIEKTQEMMMTTTFARVVRKDVDGNVIEEEIQQLCFSISLLFQNFHFKLAPPTISDLE